MGDLENWKLWATMGLVGMLGSLSSYFAHVARSENKRVEWFLVFSHGLVGFSMSSGIGLLLIDSIGEVATLGICGLVGHGAIRLSHYVSDRGPEILDRVIKSVLKIL